MTTPRKQRSPNELPKRGPSREFRGRILLAIDANKDLYVCVFCKTFEEVQDPENHADENAHRRWYCPRCGWRRAKAGSQWMENHLAGENLDTAKSLP